MKRLRSVFLLLTLFLLLSSCSRVNKSLTILDFYPGKPESITSIQIVSNQENRQVILRKQDEIKKWIDAAKSIPIQKGQVDEKTSMSDPDYRVTFREGTSYSTCSFKFKRSRGLYQNITGRGGEDIWFTPDKSISDLLTPYFSTPAPDLAPVDPSRPDASVINRFTQLSNEKKFDEAAKLLMGGKENPNYRRGPTPDSLLRGKTNLRMWDKTESSEGQYQMDESVPYWDYRTFLVEYQGDWKENPRDALPIDAPRYEVYTLVQLTSDPDSPWLIYNITGG
ncbi:hypothetical protein [Gorillibacterium sp. sgz500922]|uniref:hypothetical protein n=1 Tax=Gorillibacterium sp. sgz500922 TaxID=3446694 RepID=UPI003F66C7C0